MILKSAYCLSIKNKTKDNNESTLLHKSEETKVDGSGLNPTLYFFPGVRLSTSDNYYFYKLNKKVRKNFKLTSEPKIMSLRQYLRKGVGLFSNNYYSTLLTPKISTKKTVAGVSRDKKRSMLTKVANISLISGLKLNLIATFRLALVDFYLMLKSNKGSNYFLSSLKTYKDLVFLNTSYKDSSIPIIEKLTYLTSNSTPKFVIKKHINKLPGRKKKKKGPLSLRSYLAFIEPNGRKLSSLK